MKATAQAIPVYVMGVFRVPQTLTDDFHRAFANFWWGKKDGKNRKHWISWNRLCNPKSCGGLNFRDMGDFNEALLAKQLWRIWKGDNSILSQLYKAKYFPNNDFFNAGVHTTASLAWRSMWSAKDILLNGLKWRIGNGLQVRIWEDNWISTAQEHGLSTPVEAGKENWTVSKLIDPVNKCWNNTLVKEMFNAVDVNSILSIPISQRLPNDDLIWNFTKNGSYSVKSGYWVKRKQP